MSTSTNNRKKQGYCKWNRGDQQRRPRTTILILLSASYPCHLGSAACIQANRRSSRPNQEAREGEIMAKSADADAARPADIGMD